MPELAPVSPGASRASAVRIMVPTDVNFRGSVSGGQILAEIDRVASISPNRPAKANCVTASFGRDDFMEPVHVGEVVDLDAELPYARHASVEECVRVRSEALVGGASRQLGEAYVTMGAIDSMGRPVFVPALRLESDEERRRYEEGRVRMEARRRTRADRPA